MSRECPEPDKRPLHLRIRKDIETQIKDGRLRPGQKIPFEHVLMQTYGCARMTVNHALSALSAEGLIERRKRAGSFVKLPRVDSTVLDVPDIQIEVAARGETYRFSASLFEAETSGQTLRGGQRIGPPQDWGTSAGISTHNGHDGRPGAA